MMWSLARSIFFQKKLNWVPPDEIRGGGIEAARPAADFDHAGSKPGNIVAAAVNRTFGIVVVVVVCVVCV